MEPFSTQQEILLSTDTEFAHRQWADKNEGTAGLSAREQLEKACWDGLVKELIPELDITLNTKKSSGSGRYMKQDHFWLWIFMKLPVQKKERLPSILISSWKD